MLWRMLATLRVTLAAVLGVLSVTVFLASCSSVKPVVVGSKNETEQMLLGEIVAQHLEHRLGRTVERRSGLGGTAIMYQSLLGGEVGIYPEYTGMISSEILKEPADPDPQIVLARVRGQMELMQIEVLDPLGFDNPSAIAVSASRNGKLATLSDAARQDTRWKLGISYEFQARPDGLQKLSTYRLSMASPRVLDSKQLFAALEKGDVDMIATRANDGHLTSPDWKVLADDQKAFPSYEACLLVRKDLIAQDPGVRPALAELSGKFQAAAMRRLNAAVEVEGRPLAAVAADFLAQAGLK